MSEKTPYHDDEPLPDIDWRWVCVSLIADRLISRSCSPADVICNLQMVMHRGLLRNKLQACTEHRRTKPSEWDARLQLVTQDSAEGWFIEITQDGEPLQANLYLWEPDCHRLWFCGSSEVPVMEPPKPALVEAAELAEPVAEMGSLEVAPAVNTKSIKPEPAKSMTVTELAAERDRRIREAKAWLRKEPDLAWFEVLETLPGKPPDPYTRCKEQVQGLKYREFIAALRAERGRRRAKKRKSKSSKAKS